MLLKSQSMSCLLDAETPVKHHSRSPSHDATIIGKAENFGASDYHLSLDRLRESISCDHDRTPPPVLWSRNAKTRGMETLESINQELSRRCHELSLQIQALKEESSYDQRHHKITLRDLQCERDTLRNDTQRLLRDCMTLEQKWIEINFQKQSSFQS